MRAEILALKDRLRMCCSIVLESVLVETDSLVAVLVIKQSQKPRWRYIYDLRTCWDLLGTFALSHVFREQYHVADRLAACTHEHQEFHFFYHPGSLPGEVYAALGHDVRGLYSYRK